MLYHAAHVRLVAHFQFREVHVMNRIKIFPGVDGSRIGSLWVIGTHWNTAMVWYQFTIHQQHMVCLHT